VNVLLDLGASAASDEEAGDIGPLVAPREQGPHFYLLQEGMGLLRNLIDSPDQTHGESPTRFTIL